MKCPIDDAPLSVSSREGVEIDFCPQCRGVWLDRGELDKIIDRAANALSAPAPTPRPQYDDDRDRRGPSSEQPATYDRKRKRRSFLDDLFDFD